MIHPPLQACREHKWETAAVAFAVAVVIAIPVALAVVALCAQSAAAQWLASYTPIVYLEPDVTRERADALADEIAAWPLVKQAEVRAPEQAHTVLMQRLGEDVVSELGVTPSMLPTSILIEPALPVVGHIDLVSRVAGLEARMEVDAIEVPSSDAMQVITVAGVGLGVATLFALFGLLAALVLLFGYLRRLRSADGELDRVVALFGAYSSELRRPTFVRGIAVSTGCGVMISLGGAVSLLAWQLWSANVLGAAVSTPITAWTVVALPALVIPVVGFLAAWFASRTPVQIWERSYAA